MDPKKTFIVHILSQENGTWQGSVFWTEEKRTENFRSLLELIKLVDTAINLEEIENN